MLDPKDGPQRTEIPQVIGSANATALAEHLREQRPLILRGAFATWYGVNGWTPTQLAEIVGDDGA